MVWYHEIRGCTGITDCTKTIDFTNRLVCFGLPPLRVWKRADQRLFLNFAKRRFHLTRYASFDIFRRAEESTTSLNRNL